MLYCSSLWVHIYILLFFIVQMLEFPSWKASLTICTYQPSILFMNQKWRGTRSDGQTCLNTNISNYNMLRTKDKDGFLHNHICQILWHIWWLLSDGSKSARLFRPLVWPRMEVLMFSWLETFFYSKQRRKREKSIKTALRTQVFPSSYALLSQYLSHGWEKNEHQQTLLF